MIHICLSKSHLSNSSVTEWPRLVSSLEKPHWLRIDFDHWEDLSDGEDGEGESEGERDEKKALARERIAEIKEKQVIQRSN